MVVGLATAADGVVDVADAADSVTAAAEVVIVVHLVEAVEVLARAALPTSRAGKLHFSRAMLSCFHLCLPWLEILHSAYHLT